MTWARNLAILILVIMSALALNIGLTDGMGHGVGLDTFLAGTKNPWQTFINQDLVSGLILTVGWMIYRQRGCRTIDTIAWVWMAIWWGNIVVATYIIVAVAQSGSDASGFFLGSRSAVPLRRIWAMPGRTLRGFCFLAAAATFAFFLHGLLTARSAIAETGYLLAFPPIILSALLLAVPNPNRPQPHP
jgi:hypothetical protein